MTLKFGKIVKVVLEKLQFGNNALVTGFFSLLAGIWFLFLRTYLKFGCQNLITIKYYFTPTSTALIEKRWIITSVGEDIENLEPS